MQQILTESVLLSLLGGVVGLLFAQWGVDLLLALKPENLPRLETIHLDARVLSFALFVSVLTGIVFGLAIYNGVILDIHFPMVHSHSSRILVRGLLSIAMLCCDFFASLVRWLIILIYGKEGGSQV